MNSRQRRKQKRIRSRAWLKVITAEVDNLLVWGNREIPTITFSDIYEVVNEFKTKAKIPQGPS